MALYDPLLSRTITYSGTFSLPIWYHAYFFFGAWHVYPVLDLNFTLKIPIGNSYITVEVAPYGGTLIPTGGAGDNWLPEWTVTADTGLGPVDVQTHTDTVPLAAPPASPTPAQVSADWSVRHLDGSYTITAQVVTFADITDTGAFPTYGGSVVNDFPTEQQLVFADYYKPGSTLSVSITSNGLTAHATATIPPASGLSDYIAVAYDHLFDTQNQVNSGWQPLTAFDAAEHPVGITSSIVIIPKFNGDLLTAPFTKSDTYHTADFTGGILLTTIPPPPVMPLQNDVNNTGQISCDLLPPKKANLNIKVNAVGDAYPGNPVLVLTNSGDQSAAQTASGGSLSLTVTQRAYTITTDGNFVAFNGVDQSNPPGYADVVQWGPISAYLQSSWLSANQEDTNNWRCLHRTWPFTSYTMRQDATANPDNAPSTSHWTAGAHTVVTNGGGGVQATVDNVGPGSMSRTFANATSGWLGTSFAAYRYLRLYLTGDVEGLPARVTLTNPNPAVGSIVKYWDVIVPKDGDAPPYVDIDLCSPQNLSAATDPMDTRYPLSGPGTPRAVADSTYWGVSNVSSLAISNLSANHVYTLTQVQLLRKDHSRLNVLPAFAGDGTQWIDSHLNDEDGSFAAQYRSFLVCETDGRISYEGRDGYRTPTGTGSFTYSQLALSTLAGFSDEEGNANGGWVSTPNTFSGTGCGNPVPPLKDCYLNNNLPATYARGGGLLCVSTTAGAAATWQPTLDLGVESDTTILAQSLFDGVDWPPGIGDAFGFLASGSPAQTAIELRIGKLLRGDSWGLVFNQNGNPVEKVTVVVKRNPGGEDAGNGASDSFGWYRTGLNYGKGKLTYDTIAQSGTTPFPTVTREFRSAKRHRACFRVTNNPAYKAIECESVKGRFAISAANAVRLYEGQNFALQYLSPPYTDVDVWVRFRFDKRRNVLGMIGLKTGTRTYSVWRSQDGGQTATKVGSMNAHSAIIECDSERGLFMIYYTDTSDNAFVQLSQDGLQTLSAPAEMRVADSFGVLSQINGMLLDSAYDERRNVVGIAVATVGGSPVTSILKSQDAGFTNVVALT